MRYVEAGDNLFGDVKPDARSFHAGDAVTAMAVLGRTIWLALRNGGVEVREVDTGVVVHVFASTRCRRDVVSTWCMLPVQSSTPDATSEAIMQMWLGLSSGAIEVYRLDEVGSGRAGVPVLLRQLRKHLSGVYCMAQFAGTIVYSGASDFQIAQWRVSDGALLRVFSGHSNYVRCLYAEGGSLVSGSDDRTVRVWQADSGALLHAGVFHQSSGGVSTLCRVGVHMWSGDAHGLLAVWTLDRCKLIQLTQVHHTRITVLRKVGSRVYVGSAEGTLCILDARDATLLQRVDAHAGCALVAVQCAIEVDRYFVWTGAGDCAVRCWHHDEYMPMTAERDGFNDMCWYYATYRPYRGMNATLLDEQRELAELLHVCCNTENTAPNRPPSAKGIEGGKTLAGRALGAMQEGEDDLVGLAAEYWRADRHIRDTRREGDQIEELRRQLDGILEQRRETLQALQDSLRKVNDALQQARLRSAALSVSLLPNSVAGVTPLVTASVIGAAPVASLPVPGTSSRSMNDVRLSNVASLPPSAPTLPPTDSVAPAVSSSLPLTAATGAHPRRLSL